MPPAYGPDVICPRKRNAMPRSAALFDVSAEFARILGQEL